MEIQAKNISVIDGHLTAKDKTAKAIIASGLSVGKVGRKTYSIAENTGYILLATK